MKRFFIFFSFLICTGYSALSQEPNIYTYSYSISPDQEKKVGFVTLTDGYPWSEHPDSLAVNDEYLGHVQIKNDNYHEVDPDVRSRFLDRSNIEETDTVFIFNFPLDSLTILPVKNLPLIAWLSIYTGPEDIPLSQYDYHVGLKIDSTIYNISEQSYSPTFVYIGNKNPFRTGKITRLRWEKVEPENFPSVTQTVNREKWFDGLKAGDVYYDSVNGTDYFLQNLGRKEIPTARHLVVRESEEIIFSHVYYDSEGRDLIPRGAYPGKSNHWTGEIFKNLPPILFGFTSNTFGCPRIFFTVQSIDPIRIKCDNRH